MDDKIKKIVAGVDGLLERIADEKGDFYDGQRLAFEDARELIYQQYPELNESENERIYELIYSAIKHGTPIASPKNRADALAYLEKQKEQKQSEDEKEYVRTLKSLISDFLRCGDEIDRVYYQKIYDWLDNRHIEQKPAECIPDSLKFDEGFKTGRELGFREGVESVKPSDWDDGDNKIRRNLMSLLYCMRGDRIAEETYQKYYPWLRDLPKRFNLQQKPAEWSEEDEKMIETICKEGDLKPSEVRWFKLLPERLNLQSKQEWSKNFEDNIRNLLHDKLTGHSEDGRMSWATLIDDKTLKDIVNGIWFYVGKEALTSLCPHWKPSEEQMAELLNVITQGKEFDCDILAELYEQLDAERRN